MRHPHVAYDLLDIASFVADYASNDFAVRKLAEIEWTIRKLRDLPRTGSFRDEIAAGGRANLRCRQKCHLLRSLFCALALSNFG